MSIELYDISECHKVVKPWGQEVWLQSGSETYPFALKELVLLSGNRTSLQVHQFKSETIIITAGTGFIIHWHGVFDCERFLSGGYSEDEIAQIKIELQQTPVQKGSVFHTPPGTIHRMIAMETLVYTEASTTQLDDVIRLEDAAGRAHGRIESEHV